MKVTKAQAQANRARIVDTASTLFRERGYDGVGEAGTAKSGADGHVALELVAPLPRKDKQPGALLQVQAGTDSAFSVMNRYEKTMRLGPREYSWFIYRVTNPTIREMFMYPTNQLRVKEALMSLLAGDIYGKTPIWPSLWALKGIYYMVWVRHFKRSIAGWRRHAVNIRDYGALQGENVQAVK